jgi:hypothetical protein
VLDQRETMTTTREKPDAYVKDVVVAAIRRKSSKIDMQPNSRLWDNGVDNIKMLISSAITLEQFELPILYAYIDRENWTLITSRRIFASHGGRIRSMLGSRVTKRELSNFKGRGAQPVERMTLFADSDETIICPFETGEASMVTIYAQQTMCQLRAADRRT